MIENLSLIHGWFPPTLVVVALVSLVLAFSWRPDVLKWQLGLGVPITGALVGLTGQDFQTCVTGQKFGSWVDSITKAANAQQVTETPTVLINGQRQPDAPQWSPDEFRKAVAAAR